MVNTRLYYSYIRLCIDYKPRGIGMDQTDRPHIILIMTDQQRTDTISAWAAII